jgi:hypothetical protein
LVLDFNTIPKYSPWKTVYNMWSLWIHLCLNNFYVEKINIWLGKIHEKLYGKTHILKTKHDTALKHQFSNSAYKTTWDMWKLWLCYENYIFYRFSNSFVSCNLKFLRKFSHLCTKLVFWNEKANNRDIIVNFSILDLFFTLISNF